mmetsp:Transcript_32595/g.32314  ORF Transcript_32595/g.32314 Transcript_32595/m.32314 type:complete len:128 (+) Transcript_32595:66-449(+)|eukprot:CAMPEP_0202943038 /NCGR_PEP_ID=MMETSP1395-20130829/3316_1 /ASSEMBLY_ACC=CAM_ASM_000871 /TAXON_ID=5961 /ORGANISM="Blepharisma japonicum, Strain Stock R1072" /LENGTH=127 /DNA_ID=CAMNT_0049639953 /DNA_START=27 /DNA_END=410 /DNA_ORIENTATION=+
MAQHINPNPVQQNLSVEELAAILRDPQSGERLSSNPELLQHIKDRLDDPDTHRKVMEMINRGRPLLHGCPVMYGGLGGTVRKNQREKYQSEINSIKQMGFSQEDDILDALIDSQGDISRAIDALMSR